MFGKNLKVTYSYNDVSLVPAYSDLKSRSEANPEMHGYKLPIIGSCMNTLGRNMMEELISNNIPFIAHRAFQSAKEQYSYFIPEFTKREPFNRYDNIWFAVGSVQKYKEWIDYLYFGVNVRKFCVDMAHGDSKTCIDTIKYIKSLRSNNDVSKVPLEDVLNNKHIPKATGSDITHVIAGNVATLEGFKRLQKAGADGIRVGVASGSICFLGDQQVTTINGKKNIKDIKINDIVLNRKGKYEKVLNTISRPYSGNIININNKIKCTPNHPIFVIHKKYKDIVNDSNYLQYGQWLQADQLTSDYFMVMP